MRARIKYWPRPTPGQPYQATSLIPLTTTPGAGLSHPQSETTDRGSDALMVTQEVLEPRIKCRD